MGRRVIPHWYDLLFINSIYLALFVIAALVGPTLYLIHYFRSSEAQAAMQATPAPIDGKRAFGYLEKICEIGPRVAGSEANARQRKMVADHFAKAGGQVKEQPFHADHPLTGQRVDMVNLMGSWHPERLNRVVLCATMTPAPAPIRRRTPTGSTGRSSGRTTGPRASPC